MYNLERFKEAQETMYPVALEEIIHGKKMSCWIWFIFPQLKAMGESDISKKYGIEGIEEARAYLEDSLLRGRLVEISEVLLNSEEGNIVKIMGFTDAMKLRSSMTLFMEADGSEDIFKKVLDRFFDGEADSATLRMLCIK